jgi:hypothetical protein
MRIHWLSRTAAALALASSAVFIAGCGDDTNDNTVTNPAPIATPTPAPAATPTPAPAATPTPPPSGQDANRTSFLGNIKSINGNLMRIGGENVITDGSTVFSTSHGDPLTIDQLSVGDLVRVRGVFQGGGAILAEKITLQ